MKQGTLISIEGPEGAGKSSVLEALLPRLEKAGIAYITTREPGGVEIAEKIREVILDPSHTEMDPKTELLLYIASRRQHLAERVLPALKAGKLVIMDRTFYFDIDVEEGLARIAKSASREVNRLDLEGLSLHQKVRQGYLAILEKEPQRVVKIDASQPFDQVVEDTWLLLKEVLEISE